MSYTNNPDAGLDRTNFRQSVNDINPMNMTLGTPAHVFHLTGGLYTLFGWGEFGGATLAFQIGPTKRGPWFDLWVFTTPGFKMFGDTTIGSCEARWVLRGATGATLVNGAVVGAGN